MKHYFILSFDAETNEWEWDTEQESDLFVEGTVWNPETEEWTIAYLGDGEYIDDEDVLSEQLGKHIRTMNEERKGA